MSDKRRAEIEAKKLKLAELRKARVDRQKADIQRRGSDVSLISHSFSVAQLQWLIRPHLNFPTRAKMI
jgi:hypothetical protein